ncbi:polysaccharide biosynthesis protein [Bacillus sp. MT(2024)]|uniref:polysaccharide biosynthesis protein n=1 Tax=Bacillus sp. MT(2024) TaxID=3117553 RepID=UPI002ED3704C
MSIDDAATLTPICGDYKGRRNVYFKMESLRLEELLHGFEEYAFRHGLPQPAAVEVGKRPGEKLHEELTSPHETESLYEWGNLRDIAGPRQTSGISEGQSPQISIRSGAAHHKRHNRKDY